MTETAGPARKRGSWSRRAAIGAGALAGTGVLAGGIAVGRMAFREGGAISSGQGRARIVPQIDTLPSEADVVVIGGGNIGCFAALELAERGLKVVLCEKGVIAGEASGRSLGYVDCQMLDPIKLPLIARSKQLWEGLNARVGAETGYRRTGLATFFSSKEGAEAGQSWTDAVKGGPGVDARMLSARDAAALAGGDMIGANALAGALYQPSDGVAEPQLIAPAVALKVRQLGGKVVQNCAVRAIETAGGRVTGVITEKGVVKARHVVLAGGAWSPLIAHRLGLDLPQFMAFGTVSRIDKRGGPAFSTILAEDVLVMRHNLFGGHDICHGVGIAPFTPAALANAHRLGPAMQNMADAVVPVLNFSTFATLWQLERDWPVDGPSPFERFRVLTPEPTRDDARHIVTRAGEVFNALAGAHIQETWAGALMTTPDNMPVLSAVEQIPGLVAGSGFYYGLTMGPAAGEALADLVTGKRPAFDLSNYRLSRFVDGTPITFRT